MIYIGKNCNFLECFSSKCLISSLSRWGKLITWELFWLSRGWLKWGFPIYFSWTVVIVLLRVVPHSVTNIGVYHSHLSYPVQPWESVRVPLTDDRVGSCRLCPSYTHHRWHSVPHWTEHHSTHDTSTTEKCIIGNNEIVVKTSSTASSTLQERN